MMNILKRIDTLIKNLEKCIKNLKKCHIFINNVVFLVKLLSSLLY